MVRLKPYPHVICGGTRAVLGVRILVYRESVLCGVGTGRTARDAVRDALASHRQWTRKHGWRKRLAGKEH